MFNSFLKNQRTLITTSQSNNATTTFADVTGMVFPLLINTVYMFQFDIIWQSSLSNTGISFGVNGPSTPTYVVLRTDTPTSLSAVTRAMVRAYNTGTATNNIDTANVNCFASCYGFVSNGANAGDFALRFKSETTTQVSVMAGTVGRIWRINPSN